MSTLSMPEEILRRAVLANDVLKAEKMMQSGVLPSRRILKEVFEDKGRRISVFMLYALKEGGANFCESDPDTQENLLHIAAPYADKEKIHFLCNKTEIDANARAANGDTPLLRLAAACQDKGYDYVGQKWEAAKALIKAGADREARNKEGQQAVDLLRPDMPGYRPMRDLLCPSALGRVVRFVTGGLHY